MSFRSDAAGRTLHLGDVIGGTTTQPYPATVIGTITAFTDGDVTVETDPAFGERHPTTGNVWTLPRNQVFYLCRNLDGRLRDLGMHLAHSGPALFYVTSMENDARTVIRIDESAPTEERERGLCQALTMHALSVQMSNDRSTPVVDDGPTLVYAASDQVSVTRADQTTIGDGRERGLCVALLSHANDLCCDAAPRRSPSTGEQA